MKSLLIFTLIVFVIEALNDREQWAKFKKQYNKNYGTIKKDEERFLIFQQNLRIFEENKEMFEYGEVSYQLGINRFSDQSEEELMSLSNRNSITESKVNPIMYHTKLEDVPDEMDWRTKGAITEVKDLGNCLGATWAFTAVAAAESRLFIQNETLISLSAQNLLDCDSYDFGCKIGFMDTAFMYMHSKGLTREDLYPYTGVQGECTTDSDVVYKTVVEQIGGDEEVLWGLVGRFSPIAVNIDGACLYLYKSGILTQDCGCENRYYKSEMDALVVGYGTENQMDYWILKHSWGPDWGENGYFRLQRNFNNTCGIANELYFPLEVTLQNIN